MEPRKRLILAGKNAIVVDNSDVGTAVSLMLARAGARVMVGYSNNAAAAKETVAKIEKMGYEALPFHINSSDDNKSTQRMIDMCVGTFGGSTDILVNTGNFKNTISATEAAIRHMKKKKYGRIINVIPVGINNHDSVNAELIEFTKSASKEFGKYGVNVNAICHLGVTKTEMAGIQTNSISLGRFAEPEEIAPAFVFLASDDAAYITGHVLNVDGGYTG